MPFAPYWLMPTPCPQPSPLKTKLFASPPEEVAEYVFEVFPSVAVTAPPESAVIPFAESTLTPFIAFCVSAVPSVTQTEGYAVVPPRVTVYF